MFMCEGRCTAAVFVLFFCFFAVSNIRIWRTWKDFFGVAPMDRRSDNNWRYVPFRFLL